MHADPIRLRTFRDFLDHNQGLQCWCPGCKRYAKVEASMWVALGKGNLEVKHCRPRCANVAALESGSSPGRCRNDTSCENFPGGRSKLQ